MAVIVVIDDHAALRTAMRRQLAHAGHTVFEAADGAEGVALCGTTQPDMIVCDIFMPVMEGIETIREIRRKQPGVKIIAMSGSDLRYGAHHLDAAQKLGADATLAKPWRADELLEVVERLLLKA